MRSPSELLKLLPLLIIVLLAPSGRALAQSEPEQLAPILKEGILSPDVSLFQLKQYILSRVAKPPAPSSAQQWTSEAKRLREHLLQNVVFHGWPKEWVDAPPKFEDLGFVDSGPGYRLRKLRYEIVPGLQSTAILYEPTKLQGRVPAILNVNGHVGPPGKSVEYKPKTLYQLCQTGDSGSESGMAGLW